MVVVDGDLHVGVKLPGLSALLCCSNPVRSGVVQHGHFPPPSELASGTSRKEKATCSNYP